jgi:hypothetical protein
MPRRCVIQYAYGYKCLEQVQLTIAQTLHRCSLFGYDYHLCTQAPVGHPSWERVRMIREAIIDGYDQVFWLDTDTLWVADVPLHGAIDTDAVFHLTYHEICADQNMASHFNCGVMYVNNTHQTLQLIREWELTPDDGHQWTEQWSLNKIVFANNIVTRRPGLLKEIPHLWNSLPHIEKYRSDHPVVIAWHGHPNPNRAMREFLNR